METKAQLAEQSIDHDDNRPRFDSSGARSWLCASSLNLQLFEKARSVAADIAHLDLEDSVPHHDKARARAMLLQHFGSQRPSVTALRINSLRTRDGLKDLLFLIEHAIMPDVIILPKIEVPGDVRLARSILDEARYCRTRLFGVVESVQGWWDLRTRPDCGAGLDGLIFGAADFAADFKVDLHRADFSLIKAEIALIAARLGGIAIDSPCFRMRSETALRRELHEARRLGFVGKVAIHPSQVPIINAFFSPSSRDVIRAHRLLDAMNDHGRSVTRLDGDMIGPPFARYARHMVASVAASPPARCKQRR